MLAEIWAYVRHNSGIVMATFLMPFILFYAYSCQSTVVSLVSPPGRVNRAELLAEVDFFLAQAESRILDLDRQDLVKGTIFNSVVELSQDGAISPAGIVLIIGNLLGLGAVVDNVRKRTFINTLKGDYANASEKEKTTT